MKKESIKPDSSMNDKLDDKHKEMLKGMIQKEMIDKIRKKADSQDEVFFKTIKKFISEE